MNFVWSGENCIPDSDGIQVSLNEKGDCPRQMEKHLNAVVNVERIRLWIVFCTKSLEVRNTEADALGGKERVRNARNISRLVHIASNVIEISYKMI
jgi:hypothetical protein